MLTFEFSRQHYDPKSQPEASHFDQPEGSQPLTRFTFMTVSNHCMYFFLVALCLQVLTFDGESKRSAAQDSEENQPSPVNSKKRTEKRSADTKYHMYLTAQVNICDRNLELKVKMLSDEHQ